MAERRPRLQPFEEGDMRGSSSRKTGKARRLLRYGESARGKQMRKFSLTRGVGGCFDCVKQFHGLNVIKIDLVLEYNDESFPIQTDGEDGGGEGQFANSRVTLGSHW